MILESWTECSTRRCLTPGVYVRQTVDIRLNDCVFLPTANLEAALRALGKVDKPRVPWVDATCTDQGDF